MAKAGDAAGANARHNEKVLSIAAASVLDRHYVLVLRRHAGHGAAERGCRRPRARGSELALAWMMSCGTARIAHAP